MTAKIPQTIYFSRNYAPKRTLRGHPSLGVNTKIGQMKNGWMIQPEGSGDGSLAGKNAGG